MDENREACDCPIDYQVNYTVKVQNMKSITRIHHLPLVVQYDCYEVTRILFVWKQNKNNDFIQQLGTVMCPLRQRILEIIPLMQNASIVAMLFWTLTVQFIWQSMGQSQASRFSSKIS